MINRLGASCGFAGRTPSNAARKISAVIINSARDNQAVSVTPHQLAKLRETKIVIVPGEQTRN